MFLKRFTHFLKISKMLFAMQKGVLKFAFETHVHRVLLVLVGGFNFRLGTYNVPPGSSAPSLTTSAKREFDGTGWTGWTGGTGGTGDQKCPLKIFILCWFLDKLYIYLYTK